MVHVTFIQDTGNLDLGRADHHDVDFFTRECLEHARRHARVGPHANSHQRHLGNLLLDFHGSCADFSGRLLDQIYRTRQVAPRNRKGNIRQGILVTHVLNNHIDHNGVFRHDAEQVRRNARPIRNAHHGDLRLVPVARDSGHHGLFHIHVFMRHEGAFSFLKTRFYLYRNPVFRCKFNGTGLEDFCPQTCQFQHFLVGQFRDPPGRGHHVGIGGIHAVHVGKDDAPVRLQRRGQRHGRQIRAASSERGHLRAFVHTLKPRHDGQDPLVKGLLDGTGRHLRNPGPRVRTVGHDPDLAPGKRTRIDAATPQFHRQEGNGDTLSAG